MYRLKCDTEFDMQLDVPEFSIRYYQLLNSNKKNIIYIKDVFVIQLFVIELIM